MKPCRFLMCITLLGCFCVNNLESARILAVFQLHIKSHFIMFEALMKGLAAKGHDVVVVSHFPQKNPIPNYTDISVEGSLPQLLDTFTYDFAINQRWRNLLFFIWNLNVKFCDKVFEHPKVQELIKSEDKFDLVITESFGVDCFTGFSHVFKAPHITMSSSVPMPWADDVFGNPSHPAYIPIFFLPHTDNMDFKQRLVNTVVYLGLKLGYYYFSELPTQEVARKHFGNDLPPLSEIARNTSVILVNSHFVLNVPRPTLPAVIEVGGLHIGTPKKLPKDLEKYINEAKDGVIFFSLGSLVRSETFPEEAIQSFLDAFAELPQRVVWKTNPIPNLPKNVMTSKWLPQFDILSHPNVRVFITHGGLMGTQEAIHNGVPMIGIPLYSDQHHNIQSYVSKGAAIKLEHHNISKESVLWSLRTILDDQRYKNNAKRISQLFRDRPQTPLETAIFWTEYVIRHRGAAHLRSAALDLPWYQYLLLDVAAVILLAIILPCVTLYFFLKMLMKILFKKLTKGKGRKKTKFLKSQ